LPALLFLAFTGTALEARYLLHLSRRISCMCDNAFFRRPVQKGCQA
jgi:hypothetical protein